MINQVVKLHKQTQEGFTAKLPSFILKLWYYTRLYFFNDSCLIIDTKNKRLRGFILYNLNRNEISFISVNPKYQGKGLGSLLIKKLKDPRIIVKYSNTNKKVNAFYQKNGFRIMYDDGQGHFWAVKQKHICHCHK